MAQKSITRSKIVGGQAQILFDIMLSAYIGKYFGGRRLSYVTILKLFRIATILM